MIVNRVSMSSTDHFHKVLRAMSAKITFMRKKKRNAAANWLKIQVLKKMR